MKSLSPNKFIALLQVIRAILDGVSSALYFFFVPSGDVSADELDAMAMYFDDDQEGL